MSPELERSAEPAQATPKLRFTALSHHLDEGVLRETWQGLNKRGAAGVDGVSMAAYAEDLDENLKNLEARLKAHDYQAPNVRRTYIPKAGNPEKKRPLESRQWKTGCFKRRSPDCSVRSTRPTSWIAHTGFARAARPVRPARKCGRR